MYGIVNQFPSKTFAQFNLSAASWFPSEKTSSTFVKIKSGWMNMGNSVIRIESNIKWFKETYC